MPHDPRVLLEDVRRAAELIRTFSAGRSPDDYRSDDMLKAAIERQFIVIGEALSRLERTDPSVVSRIGDYRKIIAFRNTLADFHLASRHQPHLDAPGFDPLTPHNLHDGAAGTI